MLYDTSVPSTSNVASTIAGVEGWLPVAYRPGSAATSVYNQLVASGLLAVKLSLVGKFTGSRTGSAKADAYLWCKENYLDTGKTDPRLIAYYVDYYAATMQPSPPPPGPAPPPPPPPPAPPPAWPYLLTQGQSLKQGQSLQSQNQLYLLTLQSDCNLVLYEQGSSSGGSSDGSSENKVLWSTKTAGSAAQCTLDLLASGDLQLVAGATAGAAVATAAARNAGAPTTNAVADDADRVAATNVLWQTNTSGTGGQYWLWMQTDANIVLYKGVCCSGSVLWASNTAV